MKPVSGLVLLSIVALSGLVRPVAAQTGRAALDARVEALLSSMTLEDKVGEMTQITLQAVSSQVATDSTEHRLDLGKLREAVVGHHVGSILNVWDVAFTPEHWVEVVTEIQDLARERRTGIPVLYGIDAVHGHHYMRGATVFPQNLALAATFDPELARAAGQITAREMRASGIPWNFAPVVDVGRQPLWSRFFETFGEDPYLVSEMGVAAVEGLQGDDLSAPTSVAANLKHFLGYSIPRSGRDRTPAIIPERQLRELVLPSFRAAIEAGARTVMINSGEINGVPVHASHEILTDLLRTELGFTGLAVTDWEDVKKLVTQHRVATDDREATRLAVMAGIDMSMVPYDLSFYDHLLSLVRDGEVPESRIDESVRRILGVKLELGLFEDPYPVASLRGEIGSPASQAVSRRAAEQAITLLENRDGMLPMARSARVLLTGPAADDLPVMHGSWTYSWQGTTAALYPDTLHTVLDALRAKGPVEYVAGSTLTEALDIEAAVRAARQSDVAVVALGERPSTEQPGDISDLSLPEAQRRLASAVMATGTPTVLVLLQNRPQILGALADSAAAVVLAYESGPYTGDALADVLYGDVVPSGRLPFTYPRYPNALLSYDHKASEEAGPEGFNPQWPFGHGLSYTTFTYDGLRLDRSALTASGTLAVEVNLQNTGRLAGDEAVLVYVSDLVASITPPVRRLRAFDKVTLQPGERRTVRFEIPVSRLAFVSRDNRPVVEPGDFEVSVGGQTTRFQVTAP